MMKSVRSRLTVTFIGLIAVILAVIWGVNKWYLEDFYVTKKVQALNAMYTAIDAQIAENKDNGITIEEAMERDRDANGNITEGNLQRLIRNFSDSANVSVLIIDNSTEDATVYSTSRDTKFLKDRVDRYIFGWAKAKYTILEENEQYKIQKTYDPQRESMYLESWGFFTDNSTAFIMSAPLSSVGESVRLANQFLLYVGIIAAAIGGLVIYLTARQISKPIYRLSNLSERMSNLDFEAKYEPEKHEMEEIQVLCNSINTLSERLEETISELKSANNQLTKDIEEKTKIDEMRKEFIANVSHELKTPMTSMKVLADSLLEQENLPVEMYREFMEDIAKEIDRENQIITDLLSLVKMNRTGQTMNIQQVNINDLLEQILKRLKPIAEKKNVEMVMESFRPVSAEIDETKFTLAVSNLVENAIKYNHENGWVHVSLNADHKYFYLKVEDSGLGIPPEDQAHIFERFYRVDKSHSREIGGTGLGLAIARNAVIVHRGSIKVHSNEGEGTTFTVRIPLIYTTVPEGVGR